MCFIHEKEASISASLCGNCQLNNMLWQPLNLSETCPAYTNVTACSPIGYIYLNLLVQLYGGNSKTTSNLLVPGENIYNVKKNCADDGSEGDEQYDFIVVGAGAAGCVMANRLTEISDWKVLLLEAGPEQPDVTLSPAFSAALLGSNIDWQYTTQPNGKSCLAFGGRCPWPRGKTMGGSSAINSLTYARGDRLDFDNWAALGNEGWSYEDILPYFRKSENNLDPERNNSRYHGTQGPQYINRYPFTDPNMLMVIDAWSEKGIPIRDFNVEHLDGAMVAEAFTKDGERISSNSAYIQPVRFARKKLKIITNAEAYKVLIDENKRAYGVEYVKDERVHMVYAKKEVIVSGGSINSPKLLMLSGIGPREHLEELNIPVIQDLPVGKNLHDHPAFHGIAYSLPFESNTAISNDEMLQYTIDYGKMKRKIGPMAGNGPVDAVAFIKYHPNDKAVSIQYQVDGTQWNEYTSETVTFTGTRVLPTAFYNGLAPRIQNVVPKSRGRILLNSTDPNGKPLIYANYLDDPRDLGPLIKGAKFVISLENTKAFKNRGAKLVKKKLKGCEDFEWGSDDYIICLARTYTSTTYHPVGTCKMGPEYDETAVVDPRLRVYGVEGLRVVDASIMPVVVRCNTEAPTLMIAEKAADMVKEDWGRK